MSKLAHKCVEKFHELEHRECGNVNILPQKLTSDFTNEDLERDRKLALQDTKKK